MVNPIPTWIEQSKYDIELRGTTVSFLAIGMNRIVAVRIYS